MGVKRTGRYGKLSREYKRKPVDERLSNYIVDENGCHIWQGYKNQDGYGSVRDDSKMVLTHRVAYAHKHGPIPPWLMVCHDCGDRACINPDHLYLGTAKDNAADMVRHGNAGTQKGEGIGNSKLTEREVLAIRASDMSGVGLARLYGVTNANITAVRNRKTWRHI
jgi:hypothetical protein